jgi:hypothetical protein
MHRRVLTEGLVLLAVAVGVVLVVLAVTGHLGLVTGHGAGNPG